MISYAFWIAFEGLHVTTDGTSAYDTPSSYQSALTIFPFCISVATIFLVQYLLAQRAHIKLSNVKQVDWAVHRRVMHGERAHDDASHSAAARLYWWPPNSISTSGLAPASLATLRPAAYARLVNLFLYMPSSWRILRKRRKILVISMDFNNFEHAGEVGFPSFVVVVFLTVIAFVAVSFFTISALTACAAGRLYEEGRFMMEVGGGAGWSESSSLIGSVKDMRRAFVFPFALAFSCCAKLRFSLH